ncbi:hypothetical protein RMAECT_0968 [Rickettsia rhipicephali str. Ect]|uniref:Uncharacterized protein n=2 Tax=spotted fever group TaxID=114277 RepID=A0A0F3PF48_RICRH
MCEEKQGITVEYAIEGIQKPIGVPQFKLIATLPKKLKKPAYPSRSSKAKKRINY